MRIYIFVMFILFMTACVQNIYQAGATKLKVFCWIVAAITGSLAAWAAILLWWGD